MNDTKLSDLSQMIGEARTRFIREAQHATNETFQLAVILSRALGDISTVEAKEGLVNEFRARLYQERE